jgi:chemotaxis protein MotB
MKTNVIRLLALVFIVGSLSSCVAKRKLDEANSSIDALKSENATQASKINDLNSSLNTSQSNLTKLENERTLLQQQLDKSKREASSSLNQLNATQGQVARGNETIADQQKRLAQLQALIDQQKARTEQLRQKIADALVNFNSNELTVRMKDGKVYVSLQESLLFPSGSAKVNPKGKQALSKLAEVLNINGDINVEIEGHTDSIPIRSATYPDNWALSVARSTSIVRILTQDYKVAPSRVEASGRSSYDPIDANSTAQGRQNNRRTEIILEPKLDELMKLISYN